MAKRKVGFQYSEGWRADGDTDVFIRRVRQGLADGWLAEAELMNENGELKIATLSVYPRSHPRLSLEPEFRRPWRNGRYAPVDELSHEILSSVRLQAIREYGQAAARLSAKTPVALVPGARDEPLALRPMRPSPKPRHALHDAKVAELYVNEVQANGGRGVHGRVAAHLGSGHNAKSVSKLIARIRGVMLTETTPGVAGGSLTDYARDLLAHESACETV